MQIVIKLPDDICDRLQLPPHSETHRSRPISSRSYWHSRSAANVQPVISLENLQRQLHNHRRMVARLKQRSRLFINDTTDRLLIEIGR
jgi:hypothetical protein